MEHKPITKRQMWEQVNLNLLSAGGSIFFLVAVLGIAVYVVFAR